MPSGFSEEYFYVFTIQVNAKHVTQEVHFWPQNHLYKTVRVPPGDAKYQISRNT